MKLAMASSSSPDVIASFLELSDLPARGGAKCLCLLRNDSVCKSGDAPSPGTTRSLLPERLR